MQFLVKIGQVISWRLPLLGLAPFLRLGNHGSVTVKIAFKRLHTVTVSTRSVAIVIGCTCAEVTCLVVVRTEGVDVAIMRSQRTGTVQVCWNEKIKGLKDDSRRTKAERELKVHSH